MFLLVLLVSRAVETFEASSDDLRPIVPPIRLLDIMLSLVFVFKAFCRASLDCDVCLPPSISTMGDFVVELAGL